MVLEDADWDAPGLGHGFRGRLIAPDAADYDRATLLCRKMQGGAEISPEFRDDHTQDVAGWLARWHLQELRRQRRRVQQRVFLVDDKRWRRVLLEQSKVQLTRGNAFRRRPRLGQPLECRYRWQRAVGRTRTSKSWSIASMSRRGTSRSTHPRAATFGSASATTESG